MLVAMDMTRWHGPDGRVEGQLRRHGYCHIFHEDSSEVSQNDLLGLPVSWVVDGARYSCVQLTCGHTFHVSALAWQCLYRDMRCPMCRRGDVGRICVDTLPAEIRSAFRCRLTDAVAADTADEAGDLGDSEGSLEVSDAESDPDTIVYEEYARCERSLRMVVEVRSGSHDVFVYETPLHYDDSVETERAAWNWSHVTSHSMRCFRVQQSFTRHMCSKVATCAVRLTRPLSLKFSITHPLFRCGVESPCIDISSTSGGEVVLARCGECSTAPVTVGMMHVDHVSCILRLALEPNILVALWREGW